MQTPYAIGQRGAVAAAHPLAVEAGLTMLRAGGNAMDAAIATAFALTVVDPGNASLGGRGSLVAYLPEDARLICLDFNTVCPRRAGPDTFEVVPTREGEWWSVRGAANTIGHRAVSVPTTAAGLCAAARYARLPLSALVAPAAEIARTGFPATVPLEKALAAARERVLPNAASRTIYAPSGRTLRRGETLANPDLARTLHQLGESGRDLIYEPEGDVSRSLTRDMAENGGLIDEGDLSAYRPTERQPATISYRGHELAVTPVNNGGPTVLAALRILEGFHLAGHDPHSPEAVHLVIEALKLAWADRFAYVADPAFTSVPLGGLLSEEFAATRRATIDLGRADLAPAPGDPWPFDPSARWREWAPQPRHPDVGGDTTYCCAADSFGGFVSLTHTLGSSFGSGVTVPGTGVLLNNGMYWFDPTPGRVNSVAPGKVPLNNQAETIVLEAGRPWLAIGLPGGRRILTTLTRCLGLILDHAMSPAAALAAPRLHVEDREPVTFESSWKTDLPGGVDLLLDLQALGHGLAPLPVLERFISGPAHAVWSESGQLHAAGDPRQPGAAGAL